jgi:hypothetical protein
MTRRAHTQGRLPEYPRITVDPDKAALVRDIQRRVIDAAAGPLAAMKAADIEAREDFASLKAHAALINAAFPGVVSMPSDDTKREAGVYMSGGRVTGRLNCDGRLYIDRVATIPAHKVARFLSLMAED